MPSSSVLKAKSASFNVLDEIARHQIAKQGLAEEAITLVHKSGLKNEIAYVRYSVFSVGIAAWKQATGWSSQKQTIKIALKKKQSIIDRMRADTQKLASIAEGYRAAAQSKKSYDPARLMRRLQDDVTLVEFEKSIELIEEAFLKLDYVSDRWDRLDIGKRDPLTEYFIDNLADVWRLLFGRQPATAKTGAFVDFANASWSALGWDDYSDRYGLGKAIFTKAASENWSLYKLVLRPRTGTRTAK